MGECEITRMKLNRQTDGQTDRQVPRARQTNRQSDRHNTDRQTDKPTYRNVDRHGGLETNRHGDTKSTYPCQDTCVPVVCQ